MLYRIQQVTKVVIHWQSGERDLRNRYQQWLAENKIYPSIRGGSDSESKSGLFYTIEDAVKIESYFNTTLGGRKCQILKL